VLIAGRGLDVAVTHYLHCKGQILRLPVCFYSEVVTAAIENQILLVHKGREFELRSIQGDLLSLAENPKRFTENRMAPPWSLALRDSSRDRGLGDKLSGLAPIPARPWLFESSDSNAQKPLDTVFMMLASMSGVNIPRLKMSCMVLSAISSAQ
jgi:hypothetical protein